jgi:hypothetical protein
MHQIIHTLLIVVIGHFGSTPSATSMIDQPKWDVKTSVGPDALTGGWFINLGRTGIRVRLLEERPTEFEVAYVFDKTPAARRIKIGDRIIGAGGTRFETPHKFGYGVGKFGYDGPMKDFSAALEAAQADDGRLNLTILRAGETRPETLRVGNRYRDFSATYPYDCRKTNRILADTLPWLAARQRENGLWSDRPHLNAFTTLALLASGQPEFRPVVEKAIRAMAARTTEEIEYQGLDGWKYTLYGICLAEYYLATKQAWVIPELEEIDRWLRKAQIADGGWGHRPANRPGGNGYGSINILTMQAKMAWALMRECGIEIDEARFKAAHDFVARGTGDNGYVWYKDGGRENPGYADMGRTGAAAMAHALADEEPGYREYANATAGCIGEHPDTFSDTHGSPILGMVWTAFGAAADPAAFRSLMDENRWWFSLAHCTDGTFYYQMNRDNNPQDYTAAPRLSATAATALILSMRDRRLRMMNLEAPKAERAGESDS